MKLSEVELGKDYAIVPSWSYASRESRDPDKARENDVVKATIVSLEKYEYEAGRRTEEPADFRKAEAGNRSVGILVKATDKGGKEVYWTSRLADVVALWADLEPKWEASKQAELERQRAEQERREKELAKQRAVENDVKRAETTVAITAKELLGDKARVTVGTTYDMNRELQATVTLSLAEFETLVEMAYQGKDVYA